MKITKILICCFVLLNLISCDKNESRTVPYSYTELAMKPGMIIEANNKNGTVTIEYLSPLERRYKWDGYDEKRTLIPRKEKFDGLLGAYDPASTYIWEVFSPRIVADDSKRNFKNMEDLKAKLYEGSAVLDWVYTDDGLVIGFSKSPSRNQVNISVYQYTINNKKPSSIEGSRPENIIIKSPNKSSNLTHKSAVSLHYTLLSRSS